MSKFELEASDLRRFTECSHDFTFERDHPYDNGVVGVCRVCKFRVTEWPGGVHYDEIKAAPRGVKQ